MVYPQVVTRQLQTERRTAKARWPKTDVLPLTLTIAQTDTQTDVRNDYWVYPMHWIDKMSMRSNKSLTVK